MTLNSKNIPTINLPHSNIDTVTKIIDKFYSENPFLPLLPYINDSDNLFNLTFNNIPGIILKNGFLHFEQDISALNNEFQLLENAYYKTNAETLDPFKISTVYSNKFFETIEEKKPAEVILKFFGPLMMSQSFIKIECSNLINNKLCRKYIILSVLARVLWFVNKIKELSPTTKPIIIFHEPKLNRIPALLRYPHDINEDTLIKMYNKIFDKLHENNCLACLESFQICNWQLALKTNVDMISFNAFDYPTSLNKSLQELARFINKGGFINWAIVPAMENNLILDLSTDDLFKRFIMATNYISNIGIIKSYIFKNSTISCLGRINRLPLNLAEKAIITADLLAKKIQWNLVLNHDVNREPF